MNDRAQCITNEWVLLGDQVQQLFTNTPIANLPNFSISVTGSGPITFKANGTYHYEPNFDIAMSAGTISGTGHWGGTLDGTWEVDGNQLTMAHTENNVTGSLSIMGQEIAMPTNQSFNGTATVVDCQPMTLTTRLDSPLGAITQTLVSA